MLISPYKFIVNRSPISEQLKRYFISFFSSFSSMDYYQLHTNLSDCKKKILESSLFFEFSGVPSSPYKFFVNRSPISEPLKNVSFFFFLLFLQWIIIDYTPIYQIVIKKFLKVIYFLSFQGCSVPRINLS